ncbi:MAG: RtcB family protein [Phycisphaerae bacterium]|nr:RtcB family protein [Phycisphaerae bacterium]
MDTGKLKRISDCQWMIEQQGDMNVSAILFGDEKIISDMDEKVYEQAVNVARLPGIVRASYAMPDAHWGYGFPIGGVAAFDPENGGVISAGGVGFDISCGVRTLTTGLTVDDLKAKKEVLADMLERKIPAGVGSAGKLNLSIDGIEDVLVGGARWAVENGYGTDEDLKRIEENGCIEGAQPRYVSEHAKTRQKDQVGTLGSGNHYLEVQQVTKIFDKQTADIFGLVEGDIAVSIHCGSRGLGHQIGTDFLQDMVRQAASMGIMLPEKELACAPLDSDLGRKYIGAMNSGINCALANRQVLTHLVREIFDRILPKAKVRLLYDVSHNTCKLETHIIGGKEKKLYVHRKGATRSFGAGHPSLPADLRAAGQPVLIGGTMGTASYVLCGMNEAMELSFGSACHGSGRSMSRHQAAKQWQGRQVVKDLASRNIIIRSPSFKGIAEEAPGAYKDIDAVVNATEKAKLAKRVARLEPLLCVKG